VTARRILLLDFDGTACRGDGPVLEYARLAGRALTDHEADRLLAMLRGFLAGTHRDGLLADAQDGYQAVAALAAHFGVPPETTHAAFLRTRDRLTAGEVPAEVPTGLVDLLDELRPRVRTVLVTNAPADGLPRLLDRLGLSVVIDEVIADADKPSGLPALLDRLLTDIAAQHEPGRLLSVGDIWANDLRVPLERGCTTAYVDRFERRQGPADVRAPVIEDLYDMIRRWAS
jgi:FMN phosphatase YigB (HAD superfamily)